MGGHHKYAPSGSSDFLFSMAALTHDDFRFEVLKRMDRAAQLSGVITMPTIADSVRAIFIPQLIVNSTTAT
jgi:ApbE superfamily uncharacterized protein (UPF0280 family)